MIPKLDKDGFIILPVLQEEKENTCKCGGEGEEDHSCPYQEDINDDYETKCNCCRECRHECAMDI